MTEKDEKERRAIEAVHDAFKRHGNSMDEMIPIMTDVNRAIGYLPKEALGEISRLLQAPQSQIFSAATFYTMLSTKPRGKHVIQFCESAPCHVVGGREVWTTLQDKLGLENGQTSPDGKWSLITTSCLGVCGVGPVIIVDEDLYGNVTPTQVEDILSRYE
jgi:NADH-quinone oxidoreductase subunit E